MCYACEQQLQYCMVLSKPGSNEERKEFGPGEGGMCESVSVCVDVCVSVCCGSDCVYYVNMPTCTCSLCIQPSDASPKFYNVRPRQSWNEEEKPKPGVEPAIDEEVGRLSSSSSVEL